MQAGDEQSWERAVEAHLEVERMIERADSSHLRALAVGWVEAFDAIHVQEDATTSAVAWGVFALLATDGDTSHRSYQELLEAGFIDEDSALTIYQDTLKLSNEREVDFATALQVVAPAVHTGVQSRADLLTLEDELVALCER